MLTHASTHPMSGPTPWWLPWGMTTLTSSPPMNIEVSIPEDLPTRRPPYHLRAVIRRWVNEEVDDEEDEDGEKRKGPATTHASFARWVKAACFAFTNITTGTQGATWTLHSCAGTWPPTPKWCSTPKASPARSRRAEAHGRFPAQPSRRALFGAAPIGAPKCALLYWRALMCAALLVRFLLRMPRAKWSAGAQVWHWTCGRAASGHHRVSKETWACMAPA